MSAVSSQACAVCKFQRRKCAPDCPLAPYFPPDQPKQFLNVHRLFGVSNVLRILRQVDPSMKADFIKSIVYEADAWERDPVNGCLGLISILQSQVENLQVELQNARSQILFMEHSKHIGNVQPPVNPALANGDQMCVHPSSIAGCTNRAGEQDTLGSAWIYSVGYPQVGCIDQGLNLHDNHAASQQEGGVHLCSNPANTSDPSIMKVAAEGGSSIPFELHEGPCHYECSRDGHLAFQSRSTSGALNTCIHQKNTEDLKLATTLFFSHK